MTEEKRPNLSDREIVSTAGIDLTYSGGRRPGSDSSLPSIHGDGNPELTAPTNLRIRPGSEKLVRIADGTLRAEVVVEFDSVLGAEEYEAEVFWL